MNEPRLDQAVPTWVSMLFGVLSGWNVFLLALFLILIACSVVLNSFGIDVKMGDALFIAEMIGAAIVSAVLATITARVASTWLKGQGAFANYFWLGVVIVLTIFSFPSFFTFASI